MARAVGVHGIAKEHLGRNQLLSLWTPAFRDGIELALGRDFHGPSLDIAFYGDLFLTQPALVVSGPGAVKASTDEASPTLIDEDELAFLDGAASEAESRRPDLGEPMAAVPPVPAILKPIVRRMCRRFDARLVLPFISTLRQVRQYQENDELANKVRQLVLSSIDEDTTVLIGHSLGSVIAFETLTLNPQLTIDTLITLGSPLSMRTVASGLRGATSQMQLVVPNQISRWVNIYDPADPVAGAGAANWLWPPRLVDGLIVEQVHDVDVENGREPHSITRYLSRTVTGIEIAHATRHR